jgi:uncharacterized membrane protein YecN with MAPEG domain
MSENAIPISALFLGLNDLIAFVFSYIVAMDGREHGLAW